MCVKLCSGCVRLALCAHCPDGKGNAALGGGEGAHGSQEQSRVLRAWAGVWALQTCPLLTLRVDS